MNANTLTFSNRCRQVGASAAAIVGILFCGRAVADGTIRKEASVEAVKDNGTVKTAVFVIEEKTKEKDAKPVKWDLVVKEARLFQLLANGRRVHVDFTALKPGQHVRVTALTPFGITGYNLATEVIILPVKAR
jgi:hypothetical protein